MIELIVEEFEQLANLLEERCRVISIGNQKGGVGKSSLVRLLPSVLAFSGKKVLLIDMDPQANTTKSMFVTRKNYYEDEVVVFKKTLMAGIVEGNLTDLVINVLPNLDFIPSSSDLESFPTFLSKKFGLVDKTDLDFYEVKDKAYEYFNSLIESLKDNYDYIFFDTPPTVSDYVRAVSYVSDYILIAFQTQSDSLDGAKEFLEDTLIPLVENTRAEFEVVGILPNQMTKNGSIDTSSLNDAYTIFGKENVFENILPFKKPIQNIPRHGVTLEGYWNSKMYIDTLIPITKELVTRISLIEGD
ncbi:AAA family ATPase [Enterococcus faecalis]|nr:AAA family ATPase [Enterococcus faecalis]EKI2454178.1 AAA family ATPase [Enterococcus faecalis]EKY8165324.1 AAA family ATPase [Enterococcus faecalis]